MAGLNSWCTSSSLLLQNCDWNGDLSVSLQSSKGSRNRFWVRPFRPPETEQLAMSPYFRDFPKRTCRPGVPG